MRRGLRPRARPGGWPGSSATQRIQIAHAHKGRARTLALLAGLMGASRVLVLNRGRQLPARPLRPRSATRAARAPRSSRSASRSSAGSSAPACPPTKIEVIYSGTDLERFHPGRRRPAHPPRARPRRPSTRSSPRSACARGAAGDDVLEAMARVLPRGCPRARLLFVGAPPPRIAELARARPRARPRRPRARARPPRGRARRSWPPPTSSSTPPTPGSASPARSARRSPCERRWSATDLEGMPELVARRRDRAAGAAAQSRTRSPQAILPLLGDPTARPGDGARGPQARRGALLAARRSSTPPRRSTGGWSAATRPRVKHAVAVYRRLLPLPAALLPVLLLAGGCSPSSSPRWRAPSPGWSSRPWTTSSSAATSPC